MLFGMEKHPLSISWVLSPCAPKTYSSMEEVGSLQSIGVIQRSVGKQPTVCCTRVLFFFFSVSAYILLLSVAKLQFLPIGRKKIPCRGFVLIAYDLVGEFFFILLYPEYKDDLVAQFGCKQARIYCCHLSSDHPRQILIQPVNRAK